MQQKFGTIALIFLPVLFLLVFFVIPVFRLLYLSVVSGEGLTLEHYVKVFTGPAYLSTLITTFELAVIVTLISLIIGYPVAAMLCMVKASVRSMLILLILLPLLSSMLVRTYGWMILLQREGAINQFLQWIGLISEPLSLLHNRVGVILGMVHVMLPFMVLPLYSVMSTIDRRLLSAAENLGANPYRTFTKVFLPLSVPGIGAGSLITFILSLGFFITPALLGGREDLVIAVLIQSQISDFLDWHFAGALSFTLLIITLIFYGIAVRWLGLRRLWGG